MSPIESSRTTSDFNPGGGFAVSGSFGDTGSQIIIGRTADGGHMEVPCPGRSRERPAGYVGREINRRGGAREACPGIQGNELTCFSIVTVPPRKLERPHSITKIAH
jgi:hypothetical protein